jgi:carbonic anhydrase/acetyltransferase-like protein (isoleucine patch superfamily)
LKLRAFGNARPVIGRRVFIDPAAVVIGQVTLGDDVSLWPTAVVRGDVNEISVGARSNIQDGSVLHVTHDGPFSPGGIPLVVGQDVTVGHRVTLHACTVGDRCLIGMNACVMDGAELGSDILLGAGSLVTPGQKLERGSLYQGSPARHVRRLEPDELEMLRYSAAHYVRLKDRYLGMA